MNWNQSYLSCISIIVTISSIKSILGFEPVGVVEWSNGDYTLVHDAKYDDEKNLFVAMAPRGQNISLLCSRGQDHGAYEVMKTEPNQIVVDLKLCEEPFVWHIFESDDLFNIGTVIHTPEKKSNQNPKYYNVAEDFKVLGLIGFVFDVPRGRTELVWYILAPGSLLHAEIRNDSTESVEKFEKSVDFHKYDIDEIYSRNSCPFVKVPLAPEQDFLFINYKGVSRFNVLTAPMWRELYDQWQALEVFTRKVAQVLNSIFIRVGVHGEIMQVEPSTSAEKPSPVYLNHTQEKYPLPKYFYRAITYRFFAKKVQEEETMKMEEEEGDEIMRIEQDTEMEEALSEKQKDEGERPKMKGYTEYRYGIIIVMHNMRINSNTEWDPAKICPEDEAVILKTGWMRFLPADGVKTPMYGCLYNKKNMKTFQKRLGEDFDVFDLNNLPTLVINPATGEEMVQDKNILEEMKAWEEANKNNTSAQNNEVSMQRSRETIEEDLSRRTPPEYSEQDLLPRSPPEISQEDQQVEKKRKQ